MSVVFARRILRMVYPIVWRIISSSKKPYRLSIFHVGRVISFEEIPLIEEKVDDYRKYPKIAKLWFEKNGHTSKQLVSDGARLINFLRFEDFRTVYDSDVKFPIRKSHRVMRHNCEMRPDLYENVGLGAGACDEWWKLSARIAERMIRPLQPRIEKVADDLLNILHIKANEGGVVDMFPWLFRWEFESTGVILLNNRLDALSESGSNEAEKMGEAAGITNEMIGLSEVDLVNCEKYFKELLSQQDYMYRKDPPITGNGRVLQEVLILGGYQIPKDMNTILHYQTGFRLPANFEEPHVFKSERHTARHQRHMEYVFGATTRTCLGRIFALGQMAMVLAKFYTIAWRALSSEPTKPPYWSSMFPDGRIRSFEEIPQAQESDADCYDEHDPRYTEFLMDRYKLHGSIYREDSQFASISIFHFDDMTRVMDSEVRPLEDPYKVMSIYRRRNPHFYQNFELGVGAGKGGRTLQELRSGRICESVVCPLQTRFEEVTDNLMQVLHIKANEGGATEIFPWLFRWVLESIGVLVFNKRLYSLSEQASEKAEAILDAANSTCKLITQSKLDFSTTVDNVVILEDYQDYMYSVILEYVNEIVFEKNSKGLVKALIKREKCLLTKNLMTLTLDVFLGALQTVPLTVLMALYNLARNKQVQDRVREKLVKLLPTRGSRYFATVKNFPDAPQYLSGIVWETLRLHPPISLSGVEIQEDLILGGYRIPKHTRILLRHQLACLLPGYFKNPMEFLPERHPTRHQIDLEYIFGSRTRTCFGKHFAVGQMALVLAKILRDFEVSYHGPEVKIVNKLYSEPEVSICLKLTPVS